MTSATVSAIAEVPHAGSTLAEVEAFLRSLDEAGVGRWLASLDDDALVGLHRHRYYPIYLNLLALFRGEMSMASIRKLAVECTRTSLWSHRAVERFLAQSSRGPGLESANAAALQHIEGWDAALIKTLLARGRGLIVCTFRLGLYGFVPADLALLGFPVCSLLRMGNADSIRDELDALEVRLQQGQPAANPAYRAALTRFARWRTVGSEVADCTLTLAAALKDGGIVTMLPDGNAGADGTSGPSSRVSLDFFGFRIAAKSGAARLAAISGAPILPVFGIRDAGGVGRAVTGEPIFPPALRGAAAREEFSLGAMQALYGFLEKQARQSPEQWEGVAAVHRWREGGEEAPQTAPAIAAQAEEDVKAGLAAGRRYRINEARGIMALSTAEEHFWVDLPTLKTFKPPDWALGLCGALREAGGVHRDWLDREWLNRQERLDGNGNQADLRSASLSLLGQLYSRGLIAEA